MKVEIWSDVMCPFCYIGKRRFEHALQQFEHKEKIAIEWKSFQLDPDMKTTPDKSINQYLAERKGWSLSQARQMNDHVTGMAAAAGLHYDFDKAIPANSFDAHRFVHFAATLGKGDEAEERLFRAYFSEGRNIADHATLIGLGIDIGLDAKEVETVLENGTYSTDVQHDLEEAAELGVRGVPFFVLDRRYAVSGAQSEEAFLVALEKSFAEWKKEHPNVDLPDPGGLVCSTDGTCK